jgi:hypothetical protein
MHFLQQQLKDTKYISPPTILPLIHISIDKCNPDKDIDFNTPTIQLNHDDAHIYEQNGTHLITISIIQLTWLWNQYYKIQQTQLNISPLLQTIEI